MPKMKDIEIDIDFTPDVDDDISPMSENACCYGLIQLDFSNLSIDQLNKIITLAEEQKKIKQNI
jgi:hypothetical protein